MNPAFAEQRRQAQRAIREARAMTAHAHELRAELAIERAQNEIDPMKRSWAHSSHVPVVPPGRTPGTEVPTREDPPMSKTKTAAPNHPKVAKAPKAKKNPPGTKVTKEIEFPLTEAEFSAKGKAAAALSGEVADLEIQFEEVKEGWKAKIKSRESHRDDLLTVIRAKKEKRVVETVMVKDFDAKEIRFYFEGKAVETRTMTVDELQAEMDFQNREHKKAIKAAGAPGSVKQGRKDKAAQAPAVVNGKKLSNANGEDIAKAIQEETSRRTKTSAVDGPTPH